MSPRCVSEPEVDGICVIPEALPFVNRHAPYEFVVYQAVLDHDGVIIPRFLDQLAAGPVLAKRRRARSRERLDLAADLVLDRRGNLITVVVVG